jgi:acetoin utilization deacetylase AcuC-like enzyme
VGILDFDMHYGNGTTEIINHCGAKDWVVHYSAGSSYYSSGQADGFLIAIPKIVETMKDCDVILYQAGADPHIHDPFGGWLTTNQLALRDLLVFSVVKRLGVPIAWDLAGGYQRDDFNGIRPVLDIHDNTMKTCFNVFGGMLEDTLNFL